jgi:hypothetical protein
VVLGDKFFWACGQIGQYAAIAPLEPFFVFIKVSAYSPEAKNLPNFLSLRLEQCSF